MSLSLALLALFVAIQVADVATTWRGFQLGGGEAMPLGRGLFARMGFWPACITIKAAGIAVAVAATIWIANAYWFTGVLDLAGAAVLANNVRFIVRES